MKADKMCAHVWTYILFTFQKNYQIIKTDWLTNIRFMCFYTNIQADVYYEIYSSFGKSN